MFIDVLIQKLILDIFFLFFMLSLIKALEYHWHTVKNEEKSVDSLSPDEIWLIALHKSTQSMFFPFQNLMHFMKFNYPIFFLLFDCGTATIKNDFFL